MRQRIYIDTSVVGGFFDSEFCTATQALFERLKNGEVIFIISDVLLSELEDAPTHVRDLLQEYDEGSFEFVRLSSEARQLAEHYIADGVVGKASISDCQHIAIAAICRADALVSWNFKHIVNSERIKGYNEVNLKHGYNSIAIKNPNTLML